MKIGTEQLSVVHITPNLGAGGAEFLLVGLCERSVNHGHTTTVITLFPPGGMDVNIALAQKRRLLGAGVQVIHLDKRLGADPSMVTKLHRLLHDLKPHVVHTHRSVLRYTLLPTLVCRVPVRVHTVHSIAQREVDRLGMMVHHFAFRFGCVVLVSISEEVARSVKSVYGRNIKSPVIYNGVPLQDFGQALGTEKKSSVNIVVLHVAHFSPQKNHQLLVEAFALAVKCYPAMQLLLVGDGFLRPTVEKTVAEMGLENKVLFMGVREDVADLLSRCDMFVLSSNYEGVPLAILEAMATGKPVIATAVGGVPELVVNGVTGILVPVGAAEALAKAILTLAKDPDLCQRMGKAAQKRALEQFDIARAAREYEALYQTLLKDRGQL